MKCWGSACRGHDVDLDEALKSFDLPRLLGTDENELEIVVGRGRFGPYILHGKNYTSIPKDEDPLSLTYERAKEILHEAKEIKAKKTMHDFGELQVLKGPYGPYIKFNKANYKIPKDIDPETLDEKSCRKIVAEAPPPGTKKRSSRKRKQTK